MSCLKEKQPILYKPRRPEKTVLHATVRKNLNRWYRQQGDGEVPYFWHAAGDEEKATSWHSLVLKEFIEE